MSKEERRNELNISHGSAFLLAGWIRAEKKYFEQFQNSDEFSGLFKWSRAWRAVKATTGISLRCSDEDNAKLLKKFSSQNNKSTNAEGNGK